PTTSTPTAPASRRLSALVAEQLLDGTGPVSTTDAKSQSLVERLLGSPHVVLSTQGGPQRQQLVQETADRASGDSWHTSAPGTPVRTALRRAVADLSVAGQLGQYLGPFGTRVTGLHGAGPFRTHYLKAAVRGELENVRVMSDPKPASLENTVATDHKVTGSSSTTSRTTLGLQGSDSPLQQASGTQPVSGAYGSALQYAWGRGRALAQSVTRGRSTTMTYAGRMYLVVADAVETVAVRDRWTAAMGTIGTRAGQRIGSAAGRLSDHAGQALSPRRAAAALHRVRDAVMFHLPMQDAIETGLAPDGLGTGTPRNLGSGYRVPGFLRDRRFPTHPSGRLDASSAAQQLLPRLEKAGVPSHDREQVLQRLSPDFLLAHLHELTTDGMTLPVRHRTWSSPHHLPVGGSPAQVRFKLTPAGTTVKRLRTGYEVDDYRTIARDSAAGVTQDRGGDLTLSAGQRTPGSDVLAANPSLQGTATGQRAGTRTDTLGSTAMPDIATTQAHAEVVTGYILTVTMTDAAGDPLAPRAVAHVGTLHELVSAGLLTPSGTGDDGTLTEQDVSEPERAVRMLTAEQARREAVAAWRADGDDILPFDDRTGSGMLAVDIRGAANVGNALTLATARADGLGDGDLGRRHTGDPLTAQVRIARHTPLTALGTAPAQAQQEATSQGGLTAGFREALCADGSVLPTQSSARLFGQSHTVESRLYAKMHRRGARLLAVESAPRMEGMQRHKTSQATEAGITDNSEGALGTAPLVATGGAGLTNPGVTGPVGGAGDGVAHKGAEDVTLGTHVKYGIDRSMLFALPVSWLAVSEADHRITDSRPLRTLGKAKRGPRAAEAETTALVWLREDQARDYGLLDDSSFPREAAAAWDDMAKAAADLAVAEKEYYDARARTREAWLSLGPDERAALGDGDPGLTSALTTVLPRSLAESPAVLAWQAARDDAHLWEGRVDAAAADHHRLHLAASRLTAHHQGSAAVPVRDVPQEYTEPEWRSGAPAPYAVTEPDGTGVRTLTSPDGAVVRAVHEVPHDGASFFHALIAAAGERGRLARLLGADLADRFTAAPGDPEAIADAVHTTRDRLARELGRPDNRDLLDSLAPDTADTFTQEELDGAGITLSPEQQAEFDALGRLPETFWPNPAQRAALASLALARPFAAEPLPADAARPDDTPAPPARRAGDHGGADLLPALAARLLGTSLTVVTGEGREQRFLPYRDDRDGAARDGSATVDPAADPVLFAADGHFHAALSAHAPAPSTTALPAPTHEGSGTSGDTSAAIGKPSQPATHRSHTTAPWLPPADGDGTRYRLARDGVLTAPDGATYTQGTPTGRGNGFFGALSTALRHAAAQPDLDSWEAGRLRSRAGASPAQLMRLNGLPGTPAERTALFSPPPLTRRPGVPAPSPEAKEGHLRRHLAEAPWTTTEADQAVVRWAAAATGVTVTLVEENGTPHTYLGPGGPSGPHLRLRRRGGDFVPLIERTPAPAAGTSPTDGTGPDTTATATTTAVPLPPSTPASPSSAPPPSRLPSSTESTTDGRPATETAAGTTTTVTGTDTDAGPPGLDGDDAYELSPLAGDRGGQGDPTRQLAVGRRAGAVLHSLGHPVTLAGAARGRVQFGTPRPLDAVEFGLPGGSLPTAASVRRALEQEFPGAQVRPSAVTGGGRTLALSVDGVTIRITATGRAYTGTVRIDGFTLPAPADSVADAALTLATATGQDSRGRDLLDLLWALRATSADGTPSLTPATLPEDAYRAARPAGAPASLAVRLSEVLDTAALDADTLARHERTWRELGVADGDLPGLRAELTGLAHALRTAPEVTADPVRTLAARLPGLSATDRNAALALLTPADRERLAADPALVDALRTATGPEEFASVAADLMTQVPTGVGQPVSARAAARTRIARMLRDPEVTARLLKGGTRVVVVPRTEALTSLDAFRFLNGAVTGDGRPWDGVRGVGTRTAAVTEENLLGERTTVGSGMSAYPDGYSTTVHEFAHTVHLHGLDATDRQRVTNAFRTTTRHGEAGAWPDGPLHSRDADGRRSAPNYSSRDEREFFAQLTNVYLRANGGNDPYTGLPRVNAGPEWVRTRQPALYPLLRRLYGDATDTRPTDINPVEATDTENEALARARALFAVAEGTPAEDGPAHEAVRALWDGTAGTHVPQPHPPA
ncbi:hypothetical protein HET67_30755, partial [Streptomyces sp. McG7]|nr:hypothetical protein [Streptomyces sp. McG7]